MTTQTTQLALVDDTADGPVVARTLMIPFTPKSKNVMEHWQPMWRTSYQRKWKQALRKALREINPPLGARRVMVSVTLVFASKRRRDWQNYVYPLMHYIADVLVEEGVIPDDTPDRYMTAANGGIEFAVDSRREVRAELRNRTVIGLAIET